MTEPESTPLQQPRRNGYPIQNLTGPGCVVLACGILSVFALPTLAHNGYGGMLVPPPAMALMPHLLIVACMTTGLRVLGDIIALPVSGIGLVAGVFLAVASGMGGNPQGDATPLVFAAIQAPMFFCAVLDLVKSVKREHNPLPPRNRLIGLLVPVVVYLIATTINAAVVRANQRRAAVAAIAKVGQSKQIAAGWLNSSPLSSLINTAECIERFRGDSIAGAAPASLRAIQQWANDTSVKHRGPMCGFHIYLKHTNAYGVEDNGVPDDTLPHPEGDKHHVLFYIPPTNLRGKPFERARFTLGSEALWDSAEFPNAAGQRGTWNYLLDPDGRIHVTKERRRATVADSVVPDCTRADYPVSNRDCNPVPLARQRWGLVRDVPYLTLAFQRDVVLPDSAHLIVSFKQINALDSVRSLSIDWGDGRKEVVSIAPPHSITWNGNTPEDHSVHPFKPTLNHLYKTPGWRLVRARVLTSGGEQYVAEQGTNVEARD